MTANGIRLLMVDDEPGVRRFLRLGLEPHGYQIAEAENGETGLQMATSFQPDLIVLDLGLPDIDGLEVLRRLRAWTKLPVIVLTVRDSDDDKVALLEAGADDYLTKPFSMPELMARLKVALRHRPSTENPTPIFKTARLEIDFTTRGVKVDGRAVKLTVTEYNVLRVLAQARGRIVTQQQLLQEVWGPHISEAQYLRVYIGALRKKMEINPAMPEIIITDPGVGYRLNV